MSALTAERLEELAAWPVDAKWTRAEENDLRRALRCHAKALRECERTQCYVAHHIRSVLTGESP